MIPKLAKHFLPRSGVIVLLTIILCAHRALAAEDVSIDRLLNKLPPPEKLVKPRVQREVEKADPALNDPLAKRTFSAFNSGNYSAALSAARELAKKNPRSAFAQFMQGASAMMVQQWGEAASACRRSIAVEANHPIVHLALGVVEMVQNHFAAAIGPLSEASRLDTNSAIGYMLASQCAAQLGRAQESLTLAKRATVNEPAWGYAWLQLARAEKLNGNAAGTLQAVTHAAELTPDSPDLFAVVGFSYINLNKIPQAIAPLERAARLAPQDYLVQSQLGYCLVTSGQIDAAVTHLRKGAALKPDYGPVWEHLGFAYQKQGRHQEAIKAYERATQLMPGSRLSWQHLAEEYAAVGRTGDATRAASHAGGARPQQASKKKP